MNTAVDIMGLLWFAVFALSQTAPELFDLNTHRGVHIDKQTQWDEHCGESRLFKYTVPVLYLNLLNVLLLLIS